MAEIKLPEVELNIYTPRNPVEVKVVENRIVTSESSPNFVRHITFDISGTDLVDRVRIGQSLGVLPPGEDERGRPHKLRLYSIASPTKGEGGKKHLVSTTVKRTIDEYKEKIYLGVASNYLADLKPGDPVKVTGPSGRRFLLPENAEDFNYIFFATGTGIAPFRGMIQELFEDTGLEKECVLIFGCPYRTDLLYSDYFEEMDENYPNFHYLKCISREDRRPDGTKHYVQSKLEDEKELLRPILDQPNTLIYICGLKGMQEGIYKELIHQGYTGYVEIRKKLPDNVYSMESSSFRRAVKPSARTFEEVY